MEKAYPPGYALTVERVHEWFAPGGPLAACGLQLDSAAAHVTRDAFQALRQAGQLQQWADTIVRAFCAAQGELLRRLRPQEQAARLQLQGRFRQRLLADPEAHPLEIPILVLRAHKPLPP